MKAFLPLLLSLLWILLPHISNAQAGKQNNIWYFGAKAGIDFNTSPPTPLTNGAMATYEGCASVCNPLTGALLFYTDGVTVWNRNHLPMTNGTGLHGSSSSTQSALIVPAPDDSVRYYIFTAAQHETGAYGVYGIQYSVVNLGPGNGLGALFQYGTILAPGTEKLTSALHCNGRDIWVITHKWGTDEFYAFLVTPKGVSRDPVISSVGPTLLDSNTVVGALVASPNGNKLAMAISNGSYPLQVYDFDNLTGTVSNAVTLSTGDGEYGVCFSPGNSKLYATATRKLYQYDLSSNQPGQMASSKTEIYETTDQLQGMEIGPDSLVYVTRPGNAHLGVITKPDLPGLSCAYLHDGFDLLGKYSEFGLPNRIVTPHPGPTAADPILTHDTTICAGQALRLQASPGLVYEWTPVEYVSCPTCRDPIATPDTTMLFRLKATNGICTVLDSVRVWVVPAPSVGAYGDTTICEGDSVRIFAYGADYYHWEPEAGLSCATCPNPVASPTTTTRYFATGSNIYGCSSAGVVQVTVIPKPLADAGEDTTICLGERIQLQATAGSDIRWEPSEGLSCTYCSNPIAQPKVTTTYRITVGSSTGCTAVDSITVAVRPPPTVDAGRDRSLCLGDSVKLTASGGAAYFWTPETGLSCTDCPDPVASPKSTTTYIVTATDDIGCSASDSITVTVSNSIMATVSDDVTICAGDSRQLFASGGTTFRWTPETGLSCADCPDPVASPKSTTTYTVLVSGSTSGNCANADSGSVTVTVAPRPLVNVNGDSTICRNGSVRLVASGGTRYRWEPSTGLSCADCPDPVASPQTTTAYTVVAFGDADCADSTTFILTVDDPPSVDAGDDQTVCAGLPAQLHALGAQSFAWTPTVGLSCTDCPDPVATPMQTTTYHVIGSSDLGCSGIDSVTVIVLPALFVDAGPDTTICTGGTVLLSAASDATDFRWTPAEGIDCPTCPTTLAHPTASTLYRLSVSNPSGCIGSDSVAVTIDPGSITARAAIDRSYRLHPASRTLIPILLLDPLDPAHITAIDLSLTFDPRILRLDAVELARTLLDGWTPDGLIIDNQAGTLTGRFIAPPAQFLHGNGILLQLPFRGFLGQVDSSQISFTIGLPGAECTSITTSPGLVRLDSICGLNLRLIEINAESYALDQNRPNPFNPTTQISFSLGLDGPTRLTVYDASGRHVATLVDERLQAGKYVVTWDAGREASGVYYYRLDSGTWTRTGIMTLMK